MRYAATVLAMSQVWGAYLLVSLVIDPETRASQILRLGLILALPVVAAFVHGRTVPQKLLWLPSYAFASVGLEALAVFVGQQVSHPLAGLVLGVPALLISAFLAGLTHLLLVKLTRARPGRH